MHSRLKNTLYFITIMHSFLRILFSFISRIVADWQKLKKKNAIIYPQREKVNTTCMAHLVSQKVWRLFSTSRIKKRHTRTGVKSKRKRTLQNRWSLIVIVSTVTTKQIFAWSKQLNFLQVHYKQCDSIISTTSNSLNQFAVNAVYEFHFKEM